MRRIINSTLHPIYKALKFYGNPVEIAARINKESQLIKPLVNLNDFMLFDNWLIVKKVFTTEFVNLQYLIWIYKTRTKDSNNSMNYTADISIRNGKQFKIISTESNINSIIENIYYRIPWIQMGYSEELENLFKKDLLKFITLVDSRK